MMYALMAFMFSALTFAAPRPCSFWKEHLKEHPLEIKCQGSFNFFGPKGKVTKLKSVKHARIGHYNLLYLGNPRNKFKDISLMAELINERFDLMAGLEISPIMGDDAEFLDKRTELLSEAPETKSILLDELGDERRYLKSLKRIKKKRLKKGLSVKGITNRIDSSQARLAEATLRLEEFMAVVSRVEDERRLPGYLKLLSKLQALDPSWSLILSPEAEKSDESTISEFVGLYFRSSKVTAIENEFCKEYASSTSGKSVACLPPLNAELLSERKREAFVRRPFMGSFKSGNFDFTLMSSHVVYTSSDDTGKKAEILDLAFKDLGEKVFDIVGVNQANYARVAETKIMLEFAQRLKDEYKEKDIILAGDFNLISRGKLWNLLLPKEQSFSLYGTDASTLSFEDGPSSDYDHIFLSVKDSKECFKKDVSQTQILNLTDPKTFPALFEKYHKDSINRPDLESTLKGEWSLKIRINYDKVEPLHTDVDSLWELFSDRVIESQDTEETQYKFIAALLSDHMPLVQQCSTSKKDDD